MPVLLEAQLQFDQLQFKAALLSPHGVPPGLDPTSSARFEIYRSSVAESLVATLAAAFPTAREVVGADYFRTAAVAFIRRFPPRRPQLSAYGADFPDFLAAFPGADGLRYLRDLARFEWLQIECYFSDAPLERVSGADLAAVRPDLTPQLTFLPAPSLRLIRSDYAIWKIWHAHRVATADLSAIEIATPTCLRIVSDGRRAVPTPLSPAEFSFVAELAQGCSIEAAALSAASIESHFDLATILARELTAGTFIRLLKPQG